MPVIASDIGAADRSSGQVGCSATRATRRLGRGDRPLLDEMPSGWGTAPMVDGERYSPEVGLGGASKPAIGPRWMLANRERASGSGPNQRT